MPHPAHGGRSITRTCKRKGYCFPIDLNRQIAETCVPVPGTQTDPAAFQWVFGILVFHDRLIIDTDFQRGCRGAHGQANPFIHRHAAGNIANGFPVVPVSTNYQLSFRIETDFVADERIGTLMRLGDLDDQTSVAGLRIREPDLDTDLAGPESGLAADQLRTLAPGGLDLAVLREPMSPQHGEPVHRGRGRGFLEAFAEDHLTVDPTVDLVVDILDAGSREVAGQAVLDLIGMHRDPGFAGLDERGQEDHGDHVPNDGWGVSHGME